MYYKKPQGLSNSSFKIKILKYKIDFFFQERPSMFEVNHEIVFDCLINTAFKIFPGQQEALIKLKNYFDIQDRDIALIVQPIGTDKSGVVSLIPYVLSSHRVLIITPSITTANQLYDTMCGFNTNAKTFYEEREIIHSDNKVLFVEEAKIISNSITRHDFFKLAKSTNLIFVNAHQFTGDTKNFEISQIPQGKKASLFK